MATTHANAGIALAVDPQRTFRVQPRHPRIVASASAAADSKRSLESFPLPRLSAVRFDRLAASLAVFWSRRRRCLVVLLYLDLIRRDWVTFVPPQFCGPDDARWNTRFDGVEDPGRRPGAHLRLAGSLRCLPGVASKDVLAHVPPFDGLHITLDPLRSRPGATFIIRAQGEQSIVADSAVLTDCDYEGLLGVLLTNPYWLIDQL